MDPPPQQPPPLLIKPTAFERLKQQQLQSYTCTFSPRSVIAFYVFVALFFIPLGALIFVGTTQIRTTGMTKYSDFPDCKLTDDKTTADCLVEFEVKTLIPAPSYFYYHLTKFHQNARNYARSRSDVMNQGIVPGKVDSEFCEPRMYPAGVKVEEFDASKLLYPCGIIAETFFDDVFELRKKDSTKIIPLNPDNIAWSTDTTYKFKKGGSEEFTKPGPRAGGRNANTLLEDPRFVVWMRLSAFPNFDKLYGVIEEDLEPGTYVVTITANFDVSSYDGTKSFYITTVKWFGGRNAFLGTAYLVVGILSLLISITLLIKHVFKPSADDMQDPTTLLREYLDKHDFLDDDDF